MPHPLPLNRQDEVSTFLTPTIKEGQRLKPREFLRKMAIMGQGYRRKRAVIRPMRGRFMSCKKIEGKGAIVRLSCRLARIIIHNKFVIKRE
jgi:hypothetical protein